MRAHEYLKHDAVSLAHLVRDREVRAIDVLEVALARAEAIDPQVAAIAERCFDAARSSLVDRTPTGPFGGVPFAVKDRNHAVRGLRLAHGSRAFVDAPMDHDSESVRRFRAAGFVIFCSSTSPELSLSVTTESTLRGATRNPWDPTRSSGGSSGGAAALVAGGVVPMAHATDGGGSIRVPASCCGLFGLKPGRGLTPVRDGYSESWSGMTASLCVSRSVRDSAHLLDAIHGIEAGSRYGAPAQPGRYVAAIARPPARLRIATMRDAPNGVAVHADCIAAVDDAAHLLASLGHHVEEAAWPIDGVPLAAAMTRTVASHVAATLDARGRARGRPVMPDELEPVTALLAELGRSTSAVELIAADEAFMRAARDLARFQERFDLVLSPTLARPPARLGEVSLAIDPARYATAFADYCPFTALANQTGVPAMNVPLSWNADGLPIGVQLIGRIDGEATLLALAAELEAARPWFERLPALARRGSS